MSCTRASRRRHRSTSSHRGRRACSRGYWDRGHGRTGVGIPRRDVVQLDERVVGVVSGRRHRRRGYGLLDRRQERRDLGLPRRVVRVDGGEASQPLGRRHGCDPGETRLLAGRRRRRPVQLRRRAFLRLDGQHASQQAGRRHGRDADGPRLLARRVGRRQCSVSATRVSSARPDRSRLHKPVVGMARNRAGRGYWLVASDGGIFTFGDARFRGSTGGSRLPSPITGMAPTPSGNGYWLVAATGALYSFGDAHILR